MKHPKQIIAKSQKPKAASRKLIIVLALFLSGVLFTSACGLREKAEKKVFDQIFSTPELEKRIVLLEKFCQAFPNSKRLALIYQQLGIAYQQQGNFEKEVEYYKKAIVLNPEDALSFNNLAYEYVERGIKLDTALVYAKRAVELTRNPPFPKPPHISEQDWKKTNEMNLGLYLDTLGWIYFKMGMYPEAEAMLREAKEKVPAGTILYHLGMIYLQEKRINEAVQLLIEAIARGVENEEIVKKELERIYQEKHKSLKGLEELPALKKEEITTKGKAEEKETNKMSRQSAMNFSLKDLLGNTINLSDFRGQVVLVDFWATWCPPCRMELPALQRIYDNYKTKGVVLLAVNVEGEKEAKKVKEFVEQNKLTFPVLFDTNISEEYGVSGIPTLFLIDKNGLRQNKHVGYSPEIEGELTREIEELLK
ncbi:MAG: redoxin domain-containing protein [Candidatus Edwardsbacteria bacterium]